MGRQQIKKVISPIESNAGFNVRLVGLVFILCLSLTIPLAFAGELVLEFYRTSTLIEDPDPEPRLRLYRDGRAVIHFPKYMKNAGTYETQMGSSELDFLLEELGNNGMGRFDSAEIKAAIANERVSRRKEQGEVYAVSDDTITELRIMVGLKNSAQERKEIRWKNIQLDALKHPNLSSMQGLANSEKRLLELIDELMARSPYRID